MAAIENRGQPQQELLLRLSLLFSWGVVRWKQTNPGRCVHEDRNLHKGGLCRDRERGRNFGGAGLSAKIVGGGERALLRSRAARKAGRKREPYGDLGRDVRFLPFLPTLGRELHQGAVPGRRGVRGGRGSARGLDKVDDPGLCISARRGGRRNHILAGLDYMRANQIPLAGAVHDFTCPANGKQYLFFPIRRL